MTLRRYERYKDSGVEWLGPVPTHWEIAPLKRSWTVTDCKHITADFVSDGIPLASIREVQHRFVQLDDAKRTTDWFYEQLIEGGRRPKAGDLIFSRNATVGEVAQVADWHPPFALGQDVCLLRRVEPESSSDYMQYLLKSRIITDQIELVMIGSTFKRINVEEIRGLVVTVPPRAEQDGIGAFLDCETAKIDTLIAEQQRLIELLTEKRQAVIAHAVTKGLDPAAPMKDSGVEWIAAVPAHWRVSALGYVASVETGSTPDRGAPEFWQGDIPWLKTAEINYQPIREAEEFITAAGLANSAAKVAEPGTLLMAMYGQGVTRGRVATLEIAASYNQACAAISFDESIDVRFARYFFIAAYAHIRDAGNETSQMNLSTGIIRKFKLTVPPPTEQSAIVSFLDSEISQVDCLLGEAEAAVSLLLERRTALISAAVTGQIDVRGAEAVESS
jgi:type I restriction enzyme S subunit